MPETGKVLLFSFLCLFLDLRKKRSPMRAALGLLENFMRDGPVSQRTVAITGKPLEAGATLI